MSRPGRSPNKGLPATERSRHAGAGDAGANDRWSSPAMFVFAAAGGAIGFNSLWQFPYLIGQFGGGAFILAYLLFVLVLGVPLLMSEILLGRRGRASPIYTLRLLAGSRRHAARWSIAGWMAVIACFVVYSNLSVIAGWTLAYLTRAGLGIFVGQTADGIASLFSNLVHDPEKQLFWHSLFVFATALISARGIRAGVETVARWLVPLLFVLLLVLVVYSMSLGTLGDALVHLLEPDFAKLSFLGLVTALGHVFFSLGLGMGVMLMYSAYVEEHTPVARSAFTIAGLETVFAITAGLVLYAVLFAGGVEPVTGPGLAFQALPLAFDHLPFGRWFATLFFVLLAVVALLRAIALLEVVVAWLGERFRWPRPRAAIIGGGAAWILGIVSMLSFNYWAFSFSLFDIQKKLGLFDILQILTAQVLLPATGVLLALFAGWSLKSELTQSDLGMKSPCAHDAWLWSMRVVTPLLLLVLFFYLPKLYA